MLTKINKNDILLKIENLSLYFASLEQEVSNLVQEMKSIYNELNEINKKIGMKDEKYDNY